jgi:hypothetical protein
VERSLLLCPLLPLTNLPSSLLFRRLEIAYNEVMPAVRKGLFSEST